MFETNSEGFGVVETVMVFPKTYLLIQHWQLSRYLIFVKCKPKRIYKNAERVNREKSEHVLLLTLLCIGAGRFQEIYVSFIHCSVFNRE